jgi:sec-independent protein translocase protein TatA
MFEGLLQPMHLLVLAAVALFVFGPRRLPELGKGLGDGIRALKAGLNDAPAPGSVSPEEPNRAHPGPRS